MKTYNECTADVKSSLACSRSKINLSFDVWSSPNHLSMLGIVGHWIDRQRNLKTGLLALRPLEGHRGNDIAVVLLPVIKTFNIEAELPMVQYKWYPVNRPLVNGQYGLSLWQNGQYWSEADGRPVYHFPNRYVLRTNRCWPSQLPLHFCPTGCPTMLPKKLAMGADRSSFATIASSNQ